MEGQVSTTVEEIFIGGPDAEVIDSSLDCFGQTDWRRGINR